LSWNRTIGLVGLFGSMKTISAFFLLDKRTFVPMEKFAKFRIKLRTISGSNLENWSCSISSMTLKGDCFSLYKRSLVIAWYISLIAIIRAYLWILSPVNPNG